MMRRHIDWRMLPWPGRERLTVEFLPDGIVVANGNVTADFGEGEFKLTYMVRCDGEFRFEHAELTVDQAGRQRKLHLAREPGGWSVDGLGRPDLEGCTEIDIMASPFTNTLPIRSQIFVPGQARRIHVAYIRVPDLSVSMQAQDYTLLTPSLRPGRFRYHGIESDFRAELDVDEDGIVIDYGNIWRRVSD